MGQVTLTSSDLINILRCLLREETWRRAAAAIPALHAHADAVPPGPLATEGPLSGDAYYAAKSTLLRDEQALLRVLQFDVAVVLPHSLLLNLCRWCPERHLQPCLRQHWGLG